MAILLGAFIVLGVQPGPEFLRKHTDMGMGLAVVLGVVNVVAALLCMVIMPIIARVTLVPGRILAPLLLASVVLGAYTSSNDMADVIAVMAFGVLGYVMLVLEYSRAAFLLGLVLGSEVERYFMLSTNLYGSAFLLRPITLSLIAATAVFLLWPPLRRSFRRLRYGQA